MSRLIDKNKQKLKTMRDNEDFGVKLRGRLKGKEANDKSNQCVKKKEKIGINQEEKKRIN